MLLTKTFLAAAAIAGALLASPPTAAAQRRPEPPPWPAPRAQHLKCTVVPYAPPCQLAAHERPT
jgi:hypothetical protein